jgi:hypothetical protein
VDIPEQGFYMQLAFHGQKKKLKIASTSEDMEQPKFSPVSAAVAFLATGPRPGASLLALSAFFLHGDVV